MGATDLLTTTDINYAILYFVRYINYTQIIRLKRICENSLGMVP